MAAVEPADEVGRLLQAVGRGDQVAFAALYETVAPRVYGLVRQVLRDPGRTAEVAGEAMVVVWRTAARFSPAQGSALAWILAIAHRRAVDRARAERVRAERARAERTGQPTPGSGRRGSAAARRDRRQTCHCLDRLTEFQRAAITLAYYGGHTYQQVADMLDTTPPAVGVGLRDGLVHLRDCLGAEVAR